MHTICTFIFITTKQIEMIYIFCITLYHIIFELVKNGFQRSPLVIAGSYVLMHTAKLL